MNNAQQHADLATISNMFKANGAAEDEPQSPGAAEAAVLYDQQTPLADGTHQQQQHQQQQQQQQQSTPLNTPLQPPQQQQHSQLHPDQQQQQPLSVSLEPKPQHSSSQQQQQQLVSGQVLADSSSAGAGPGSLAASAPNRQQHQKPAALRVEEIEIS